MSGCHFIAKKSIRLKITGMAPLVPILSVFHVLASSLPPFFFSPHFLFVTRCSHSPGCTGIQNNCFFSSSPCSFLHCSSPSMFHRFYLDRSGDSFPLWGILGNKSNSCLHVEAHGKVLAHFSPRRIYPQNGGKWVKKVAWRCT